MPFILWRSVKGRQDEAPRRIAEYHRVQDAARGLLSELSTYVEYGSDAKELCWWAKDKLGRMYRFEVSQDMRRAERPCHDAVEDGRSNE